MSLTNFNIITLESFNKDSLEYHWKKTLGNTVDRACRRECVHLPRLGEASGWGEACAGK